MATYISKFSGVEIDRAVAYFNDTQRAGRKIITFDITASDWMNSSEFANYYVDISMSGVLGIDGATFDQPPQVYFIQSEVYNNGTQNIGGVGLAWDVEYKWAEINGVQTIRVYSNIDMKGKVCLMTVLSDINPQDSLNQ